MGKFDNALGNTVLQEALQTTEESTNIPEIVYVDIDQLDENPDNQEIFNMDEIELLARSIKDNGFTGAIEVFKKPDGRYEISSGHRRVRAMKLLKRDKVPCLVTMMPDDVVRAKKLLDSNITNRKLHPLDYARSIDYYVENILVPSGFEGNVEDKCAEYFNISKSAVYKYRSLNKMIPELQKLADNPNVPFTGLVSAHRLSEEGQKELCDTISRYFEDHRDKDGNPEPIKRKSLEEEVNRLLEREGSRIQLPKKPEYGQVEDDRPDDAADTLPGQNGADDTSPIANSDDFAPNPFDTKDDYNRRDVSDTVPLSEAMGAAKENVPEHTASVNDMAIAENISQAINTLDTAVTSVVRELKKMENRKEAKARLITMRDMINKAISEL